jgi:hypothetical protein
MGWRAAEGSLGTIVHECCCWPLQDEDLDASLGQLLRTSRGVAEAVALSASLLGMLPFLYFEVRRQLWPFSFSWGQYFLPDQVDIRASKALPRLACS